MKSCPVCQTSNNRPMKGYEHAYLVRCDNCTMVYADKTATIEEITAFYATGYDLTRFFSPITKQRYVELLEEFERYRQTNRLLDIGAGYGFFLETAQERKWQVAGTEISSVAVEGCEKKGIPMHRGRLQEAAFPDDHFDVIVMIELIEHATDINELVAEARRILRPGGLIYVTTPNFNALNRYLLKAKYDVIQYPLHLSYFTPKTLKQLFVQNGFTTKGLRTTGISRTRYKTSKGKSNQAYVSETSDDEMLRYKIEKSGPLKALKALANGMLNIFGVGESLKGRFVKG